VPVEFAEFLEVFFLEFSDNERFNCYIFCLLVVLCGGHIMMLFGRKRQNIYVLKKQGYFQTGSEEIF